MRWTGIWPGKFLAKLNLFGWVQEIKSKQLATNWLFIMSCCKGIFNLLWALHFLNTGHGSEFFVQERLRIYTSCPTYRHCFGRAFSPGWKWISLFLNPCYSQGDWIFIHPAHTMDVPYKGFSCRQRNQTAYFYTQEM